MDLESILGRIGKLFFFISTVFIISISLAGILYTDSFARELGFNFSLFDLNSYTFFTQVLISDKYQVLSKGVVTLIFIVSFICVYPKSLLLVYDLLFVVGLYLLLILPKSLLKLLLLMITPFLIPLLLVVLVFIAIVIKVADSNFIKEKWRKVNLSLDKNTHYQKVKKRESRVFSEYIKATVIYGFLATFLYLWLFWIVEVGKQGKPHAQKYLESNQFSTLYLTNGTQNKVVLISKVKNGYLFVLNESNKNKTKASFVPDSVILRIDSF
ncbi:MAG: hypothetical protein KA518_01120 [Acinetobacter sp.]|nr:hypothetical protein [Acinetobacter sp.]